MFGYQRKDWRTAVGNGRERARRIIMVVWPCRRLFLELRELSHPAAMTLQRELLAFYERSGFGPEIGARPRTVPVYTGCMLVPLPNIETRRRFLKYHDLHHLLTGYSVGRIGEGEVSAWELGSGSAFISPTLGAMNLIALSTGLFLEPKRMWAAFRRGCKSRNLYRAAVRKQVDAEHWKTLPALRDAFLEVRDGDLPIALRVTEFVSYSLLAVLVHAMIALPAVVARLVTDIGLGYTFFQAVKPKKRADIF